jgi:hypothetical protein
MRWFLKERRRWKKNGRKKRSMSRIEDDAGAGWRTLVRSGKAEKKAEGRRRMEKEERGGTQRRVNIGEENKNRNGETYTEEVLDETGNTLLLEALDGDTGRLTGKERVGGPVFLRVERKKSASVWGE